jgi:class 3 adenylate cyclase/tetratricopeptide (TPR) repeat protein
MAVCARCGTENPDGAKFCNECAAPLAEPAPAREQRKVVTALFCDVSGSTALGERIDPEALRGVMARYFEVAKTAIERHGGTVEKFIGDAVMAVFGVPVAHEDDALRAVRAALDVRGRVEVDVRIGVNTGEVVTGGVEKLATGDAVNVAARLEQAAGVGEILIGAETYGLVRDVAEVELLPPLEAKGKSEPLTAYRLLALTGEPRRRSGAAMLGREHELELLRQAYERARRESACHLFTVLGTAGIGKSRLVTEFLTGLDGARVLSGRCLSYGEGITYWPVVEILKQLGGLPDEEALRIPLEALLGREDAFTTPPEAAWAVRKTLERAAADRPLVVVFDDIQWGEPTFLDLVEHVADLSRGAPILVLCMARPELLDVRPAWAGGKHNATSVLLEPLPAEETGALVSALLADGDEELSARIAEAAAGNPLFIQEMAELARDSGGEVAVPPTIQALLAARLDSLPPEERIVLECGSVEGEVFHRGAVSALEPGDGQIDARLVGLVRKELVRPESPMLAADDAYRFRHLLIRDAAYEALPKATRIELHLRFADWLEERGRDLVELDEIVGYHLEQACRYARELGSAEDADRAGRARSRLAAAGRRALLREDYGAATNLLERAAAVAATGVDVALEVNLVRALFTSGRIEEAARRAADAAERSAAAGDTNAELCLRLEEGFVKAFAEGEGIVEELEALALEALPHFEAVGDDLGLCTAYTAIGDVAHMRMRADDAAAAFEQALVHARRLGLDDREGFLRTWIAGTRFNGTMRVPELIRFLEEESRDRSSPVVRMFLALARAEAGQIDEARAELAVMLDALRERGMTLLLAERQALGAVELELLAGDPAAAVRFGTEGCRLLEELGERGWLSTAAALLGQALFELDRLDEAWEWARRSKKLGATGDLATQSLSRQVEAKVLARRGDAQQAERLAREAVAIVEPAQHPDFRGAAHLDLATVLELVGKPDEARASFEAALDLYERKGNVVMADRVRARLAEPA